MPSFPVAIKALTQLGPEPLALYGLYQPGLRTGHYHRMEARAAASLRSYESLHPLLKLPSREALLRVLGESGQAALLQEADEIAGGNVRPFGEPVRLKLTFDQPLRHWTEYETGKTQVPFPDSGPRDVKFLWEPARFGWALTLGRAYHLSGDEKYAESFWDCFEEFRTGNPAYLGPHWMNGQEVAIRLLSLLWASQLFDEASVSFPVRRSSLIESIAEHAS